MAVTWTREPLVLTRSARWVRSTDLENGESVEMPTGAAEGMKLAKGTEGPRPTWGDRLHLWGGRSKS